MTRFDDYDYSYSFSIRFRTSLGGEHFRFSPTRHRRGWDSGPQTGSAWSREGARGHYIDTGAETLIGKCPVVEAEGGTGSITFTVTPTWTLTPYRDDFRIRPTAGPVGQVGDFTGGPVWTAWSQKGSRRTS